MFLDWAHVCTEYANGTTLARIRRDYVAPYEQGGALTGGRAAGGIQGGALADDRAVVSDLGGASTGRRGSGGAGEGSGSGRRASGWEARDV